MLSFFFMGGGEGSTVNVPPPSFVYSYILCIFQTQVGKWETVQKEYDATLQHVLGGTIISPHMNMLKTNILN